ncbi:protein translocase subunit SecD [Rhizobium sp. CFBP 8762]|nr:protein translocase subunit SecD [Rhizobium sp. CFBP 8762]
MHHLSRWKPVLVWLVFFASAMLALPNLFSQDAVSTLPSWIPAKKLALGIDLKGGSDVVLKVNRVDLEGRRLQAVGGNIRDRLREANIAYNGLTGSANVIEVQIRDANQVDTARQALQPLTEAVATGDIAGRTLREVTMETAADGILRFTLTPQGIDYRVVAAANQAAEVLRLRVDGLGTADSVVRRQSADRVSIQVPGEDDPEHLKSVLSQTGDFVLRRTNTSVPLQQAIDNGAPEGTELLYSGDDPPTAYLVDRQILASQMDVTEVSAGVPNAQGEAVLNVLLDDEAQDRLAATGSDRSSVLVLLDDQIIGTATVKGAGEPVEISGGFTPENVADLISVLQAGALPAVFGVVEERTVDPALGSDSAKTGTSAAMIASGLIAMFMMAFYGRIGLFASVTIAFNLLLIIAVMTVSGLALTLPGIAGIVLIIGMAVDSNVLVYERVREQIRQRKSAGEIIGPGFDKAYATIIDANLVMLIAALILWVFGNGPVRGFAVTVAIGICATLFVTATFTQSMVARWIARETYRDVRKSLHTVIFDRLNIRFMGIRRYVFIGAALTGLGSVILLGLVGINLGIDFNGGATVELRARQGDANIPNIRERLAELNIDGVLVEATRRPQDARIRVASRGGGENAEQTAINVMRDELEPDYDFRRAEVVGPTVSGDLTYRATLAVLISLLAVFVYIWVRFQWQFAVGAIIATIHDVLLTMGLFAFTSMEFNLTAIAAVLAVIGFSLNDTVVVYDRIRDNLKSFGQMPLSILIDTSINQTLSRTVLTSVTTLIALLTLLIFGGEGIRVFAVTMIFGVIIGTLSSIYIAGPLLILFRLRPRRSRRGTSAAPTAVAG